jgi:hypothetical protein
MGRESGRERGGGMERGRDVENKKTQEANKTTDRDTRASTVVGGVQIETLQLIGTLHR